MAEQPVVTVPASLVLAVTDKCQDISVNHFCGAGMPLR